LRFFDFVTKEERPVCQEIGMSAINAAARQARSRSELPLPALLTECCVSMVMDFATAANGGFVRIVLVRYLRSEGRLSQISI
jgi:hypothetical protein